MIDDTSPDWVTIPESVSIVGRSERTVRRWVTEKRIPSKRDGRRIFVDVSSYREPASGIIDAIDLQAKMSTLQNEVDMLRSLVERQDEEIQFLRGALAQAMRLQVTQIDRPSRRWRWPWSKPDE